MRLGLTHGQINLKCGTFSRFTFHDNEAAMAFDDGQCSGQSQTSAFAEFLCCKKRLENPVANFQRDPMPRVRHFKQHVWPRFGFGIRIGKLGVDGEIAHSQLQFATVWHGVARIDGKIEQHLMQLRLVACNKVNARRNISFDLYGFAECSRNDCLLYTSPSPRDRQKSRMPSSA